MLGQVKNIDFGVCKLLTQVVLVTLNTLLAKARQLHVLRQNPATRMSLADQVAYEPTRLGLCVHGQLRPPTAQLQQLSTRPSLQCYMLLPVLAKKFETATRKPTKALACSRDIAPAPRARSRLHRDSDLTGSVDHTHCCTLHATSTAQSFVRTRSI